MSELTTPQTQSFLERASRDPTIDVHKLEQLIALQERVADREARRQYAEAMNRLQEEMPQVARDKVNKFNSTRYASYEEVDRVIRPYYTRHGFSTDFRTRSLGAGRTSVRCVVKHTGGHEEGDHELESGPDMSSSGGKSIKTEVQGVGSVVSYLKRYTLCAAFSVALKDDETDDDGNATMREEAERELRKREQAERIRTEQKKLSLAGWLDWFGDRVAAVATADEFNALLQDPAVLKAREQFPQEERERLETLISLTANRLDNLPSIIGEEKAGA